MESKELWHKFYQTYHVMVKMKRIVSSPSALLFLASITAKIHWAVMHEKIKYPKSSPP